MPFRRSLFPHSWTRRRSAALIAAAATVVALSGASPAMAANNDPLSVRPGSSDVTDTGLKISNGAVEADFVAPGSSSRSVYAGLRLRAHDSSSGYLARVRIDDAGSLSVAVARSSSSGDDVLDSKDVSGQVATGQAVHLEAQVTGTSPVVISVKAWPSGSSEPGWQASYTDSSGNRIGSSGSVYTWGYLSNSADRATSVSYDNVHAVTSPGAAAADNGKPTAATTGVPAGTKLTPHNGDITVTEAGTHLDGLDVHGFVNVKAPNVTISNSIVRGGVATYDRGLIQDYGYPNLTISHVYVEPEHPSVWLVGLKGNNFTASHVHVYAAKDSVEIEGDNVTIEDSLIEHTTYYTSDPNQHGGPSHSDNIQTLFGKNITIQRNTIRDTTNFAILGGATLGDLPNLVVRDNWLDGGHCTVKLQILNGHAEHAVVTGNKFGPNRAISNCAFQVTPGVDVSASGNTYEETGLPVSILWLK